ncbi:hypothetical protein CRG98_010446 [Punica granatum]|uniref:Uncharacterized protein n=1 Tax=Punica granatum TaxID=22663 RepID=A0A2I0KL50_PUNGR|nr:hypothetical protein CRG98_010446 [Punica granatum]
MTAAVAVASRSTRSGDRFALGEDTPASAPAVVTPIDREACYLAICVEPSVSWRGGSGGRAAAMAGFLRPYLIPVA